MTHESGETVRRTGAGGDAWPGGVRVRAAVDADAGRAVVIDASIGTGTVPERGGRDEGADALGRSPGGPPPRQDGRIEQWLAMAAPHYLPYQLDQAAATTRTMIVVGRTLLGDAMPAPWGLASDFLHACVSDLLQLKAGLAQRDLEREAALALRQRASDGVDSFCGVLRQCTRPAQGSRVNQVSERLVGTAQTVRTLLGWTGQGIEHLFRAPDPTRLLTVR